MLNKVIYVLFHILVILNVLIVYIPGSIHVGEASAVQNVSLISDLELLNLSEELFNKSSYELFKHLVIRYQGQPDPKNFTDVAPERLLDISPRMPWTPTTKSFISLLDNYEIDTDKPEIVTKEKEMEENVFINDLLKTDAMSSVMKFLSLKGFLKNDPQIYRNTLKEMWFHLYSRSKGVNGSCGFEHVFIGERKPRKGITGLHNWISFSFGEQLNKINYFGFARNMEMTNKFSVLEAYFAYDKKGKMSTIFIGTKPELEIALYTLCFFVRPNKSCNVSFTKHKFSIQTYVMQVDGKRFVASAYPVIGKK